MSRHRARRHQVNLLLLDEADSNKRHYVLIIDISRLLGHRTKHNGKTHVCYSCLHPFTDASALDKHTPYCTVHDAQQVVYPDPENEDDRTLKYRSYRKQHPIPFHLICDFESFLTPVDDGEDEEEDLRGMRVIDEHRISGFCCYRVTKYESYQKPPVVYSGPDVMTHFYDHVMAETREISAIIRDDVDMVPLTSEQEKEHEEATICGNCDKPFASKNWKVRHHCHISGQYLFAACNNCNLQLKPIQCKKKPQKEGGKRHRQTTAEWAAEQYENEYFLPIVFHNLKGYDAHFIIKHFQRKYTKRIQKK